jgi:hypothetical protein
VNNPSRIRSATEEDVERFGSLVIGFRVQPEEEEPQRSDSSEDAEENE